ncbi:nonstructural protein [Microvirus AZ-2020]|nr:nonstructural protein [Microvirus AZ-2020]
MMKIFAVKDLAINAFGNPIFCKAQGQAIRSFMDECNNQESMMAKHPADYEMYYIGEYDEETAAILQADNIERVARATDYVNKEN